MWFSSFAYPIFTSLICILFSKLIILSAYRLPSPAPPWLHQTYLACFSLCVGHTRSITIFRSDVANWQKLSLSTVKNSNYSLLFTSCYGERTASFLWIIVASSAYSATSQVWSSTAHNLPLGLAGRYMIIGVKRVPSSQVGTYCGGRVLGMKCRRGFSSLLGTNLTLPFCMQWGSHTKT